MKYKNIVNISKTFHGVEFKPGEVKDVKKYINHDDMIRVADDNITKSTSAQKAAKPKTTNTQANDGKQVK